MSYLVDTNVLLRLAHKTSPLRPAARKALISLRARREELCIVPQNLIEFWAVATRPLTNNGLGLSVDEAAREITNLKRIFVLRPDSAAIYSEWERLVVQYQVTGKPTHDARLVAAMATHGLTHLLTFNGSDFKRFAAITVIDPSAVP